MEVAQKLEGLARKLLQIPIIDSTVASNSQ